jgi:hypothetical protein
LFRSITPTLLESESDGEGDRDEGKASFGGMIVIDLDESQGQAPVHVAQPTAKVELPVASAAATTTGIVSTTTTTTSGSSKGDGEVISGSLGGPSRVWKKLGGPPRPRRKCSGDRNEVEGKNGDDRKGGNDDGNGVPASDPASSSSDVLFTSVTPAPHPPLPPYEHKVGDCFRVRHFEWPRVEYLWSQPTFPLNEF